MLQNAMRLFWGQWVLAFIATALAGQQTSATTHVDEAARNAVIDSLISKIQAGYVVPDAAQVAIRNLKGAQTAATYSGFDTGATFSEKLTSDLRSATHDKHIAVFFDRESSIPVKSGEPSTTSHEHFNFGFYQIEWLEGNIGYLDLRCSQTSTKGERLLRFVFSRLQISTPLLSIFGTMAAVTRQWSAT